MNELQQQVKNISQQGRYGDSTLVHMNPSEVRGLSQMGQMSINPATGLAEAFDLNDFISYAAPVVGGIFGGPMGAALASGAVTTAQEGSLKEGIKAGLLSYGMGTLFQGAGAAAKSSDAAAQSLKDAGVKAGTDATTQQLTKAAAEGATASTNFLANAPSLTAPATGFAEGASSMFGTPFANQTVGGSLSNLASGVADPKVALSLGAVAADSAYQQMEEDMASGVTAANEKRKQDRLQAYLDNPEPVIFSASGGLTQFAGGGSSLLGDAYMDEEDRDRFVPTGNKFLGIDIGALMADSIDAQAANNAIDPTATYGEISNRDTLENDQINLNIAQRKAYPVNPQFRAGFQPETMYFDPATINPSYSKLTNQSPGASFGPANTAVLNPDLLATAQYGSKGGYNPNNPMVDPRLGGQVIDPYTAYTGVEPPKLLEEQPMAMAEGGDTKLPNAGLEALKKVSPETVKDMGYAEGGSTEIDLISEAKAFILGEIDDETIVEEFIATFGAEAFMALRDTVLKSITNPNAQTEGLIAGAGNGGMDDDLLGTIGGKEAVAVSQEEFIVPADVVSMLGDGSSDAGAKELYGMMDRVRQEKTGSTMQANRLPDGMLPA